MELRAGYKQTEVGIIPEDWHRKSLESLTDPARPIGYGIVQTGKPVLNGVKCVRVVDIVNGMVDTESLITTSEAISQAYKRTILRDGDLILALRGKIGAVAVVTAELAGSNLTRGVALLSKGPSFDSRFLAHYLSSSRGRAEFDRNLNGSALQEIPIASLRKISAVVPPQTEQRAIATALSNVDALLAKVDQLIAKKRDLKQAAMQQLLTGQTRLPGFSGEWTRRQMGDVINSCSSGATPYRGNPDFYKGTIKWISSGELNYNVITETIEHISEDAVQKSNLKIHPIGTFLMAITGLEAAGTRGSCGIVGSPAATNQSCMAIYPSAELRTEYLFHYYKLRGNELAFEYCQGTKQQSYTAKIVKLLPIDLPPTVQEQTAIATLLSDMDTELAALEARRDKTRALKQGMMQALLTGRIRLVEAG